MRTISINLYTWDELSNVAKRAFFESGYFNFSDAYDSDYIGTIKAFSDVFGVKCTAYSVDAYNYNYDLHYTNELWYNMPEDAKDCWLMRKLWNNFKNDMYKGKYYSNGTWAKHRNSKVIFNTDCVLTGCYTDCEIMRPIYDYMNGLVEFSSPYELFEACYDALFSTWKSDIEYAESYEYFDEEMKDCYSELMFTEDGRLWKGI